MECRDKPSEVNLTLYQLHHKNPKVVCKALDKVVRFARKDPGLIKEAIPTLDAFLLHWDKDISFRSCWALGQIGIVKPVWVSESLPKLSRLINHHHLEVRVKAIWALGRIGREKPELIQRFIPFILEKAEDEQAWVRYSVLCACENIALNQPGWFCDALPIFSRLLDDPDIKRVRREAPVIFQIIGKSNPQLLKDFLPKLERMLRDEDEMVRDNARAALRSIKESPED